MNSTDMIGSAEKLAELATRLPQQSKMLLSNPKRMFVRETRALRIRGAHKEPSRVKAYDCHLFSDLLLVTRKQQVKLVLYLAGASLSTDQLPGMYTRAHVV